MKTKKSNSTPLYANLKRPVMILIALLILTGPMLAFKSNSEARHVNIKGLWLTGIDAEGMEQSYWIALFAGTEEEWMESWVRQSLAIDGEEVELDAETLGRILEEIGHLELCFSEGQAERNCLYYCDPSTKRKVKRICFFRETKGGIITVTIDPIIEEGILSRAIMDMAVDRPDIMESVRERISHQIPEKDPTLIFPGGNEFPSW